MSCGLQHQNPMHIFKQAHPAQSPKQLHHQHPQDKN
jgi:hypothetical protein